MDASVELYRPSNGTEGECFMALWCNCCQRDRAAREPDGDPGDGCSILAMTMAVGIDDPAYPPEWRHSDDGRPICAAFVWDGEAKPQPLDPVAVIRPLL